MDDFFQGVFQFEVDFEGQKAKVPIFYRDASAIVGMFPASLKKLRKMLPEKLEVKELIPSVALLGIACFKYRDTDIGEYNEIGITASVELENNTSPTLKKIFPVRIAKQINTLIREILQGEFHAHVIHLPVTTEIAKIAGVEIYNYPKFIADIEVDVDNMYSSLREKVKNKRRNKKEILHVEKSSGIQLLTQKERKILFITYQEKDGEIIKAEVLVKANNIKYFLGGLKVIPNPETEIGRKLSDILISEKAVFSMLIPKMQAILHLPVKVR